MRIGINGYPLILPIHCGTKHYAEELLKALMQIDKINTYIIYTQKPIEFSKNERYINRVYSTSKFCLFTKERSDFFSYVKQDNVDIFHNLDPYGSIFVKHKKIITTVHDTKLKKIFSTNIRDGIERIKCEARRYFVFKYSHTFISDSQSVFHEVEEWKNSNQKNYLVYLGVNQSFRSISGLEKNRILAFADFSFRKNIINVIRAWGILPRHLKSEHILTIILPSNIIESKVRQLLNNKGIIKEVEILKNISTEDLVTLYNKSTCLVYPSLYEGFGLPILEAMACECPVITTNYGATKEIAGDAALLVNPLSYYNIAHAIKSVILHSNIRNTLIEKGKRRYLRFTWLKTAKQTLKIYNKTITDL